MFPLLTQEKQRNILIQIIFLGGIFLFCAYWASILPMDAGPDEQMRYAIPQYIYSHGKLPHGGDPAIRNEIWGTSYAFLPILSYIISAGFMKIAGIFTNSPQSLLFAARLVSALFFTGAVYYAFRIGEKIFSRHFKWVFVCLIAVLPEALFMGVYVNNDAMAICCGAAIVYYWIIGIEKKWDTKSLIWLGIWLGLCTMSYMNAYGFLLCSVFLFTLTHTKEENRKIDWMTWLKHGILVAIVALFICGWWFIRNYIIYDGDWMGLTTSNHYGDLYAQDLYKPTTALSSGKMQGFTIVEMLSGHWLKATAVSFIGVFGQSKYWMESWVVLLYCTLFGVGILGCILQLKTMFRIKSEGIIQPKAVFNWAMLAAVLIPFVLNFYHSYWVDYQPQGRYCLPGLVPIMYFTGVGLAHLLPKFIKNETILSYILKGLCAILVIVTVWEFFHIY